MCNEPFFCADGTLPGVKKLLTRMVELSHKLDPTRPAAIGGAQRPLGDDRIDFLGDIAGYNGDGGMIADFLNPGIPNFVSEYGVTATLRPENMIRGGATFGRTTIGADMIGEADRLYGAHLTMAASSARLLATWA